VELALGLLYCLYKNYWWGFNFFNYLNRTILLCIPVLKLTKLTNSMPIPVAARSKAWVCGRSLAGIVGSNSTSGMDVCLL
jgi:hypothetical protein